MHVLITGGAGYIGSVTARTVLREGHDVTVLDSLMHDGRPLLGLWGPRFNFIKGDIRDVAIVERALKGIDAVVHLAAIVGDPACARQPELARDVNYRGSLQLFNLMRRVGVGRLIFASTCSNYGRMADPAVYANEDSVLAPVSLYAETKVNIEKALLSAPTSEGTPTVTVLRLATVYGLSPRMRFDLTVNEFTMELATKKKLVVYGEQFWRPYVHVRDAACAIAMTLASPCHKVAGQVFNVGDTSQNFQKQAIVNLIRSYITGPLEISSVQKTEDPRDYRVSFEKIHQALAFRITSTVDDGIQEIISAISQGIFRDFDDPILRN